MSYLYAKIRQRGNHVKFRKLLQTDDVLYDSAKKQVPESIPYSQESILDDGTWYYIKGFSSTKYCIDILTKEINSVDYDSLGNSEEFKRLDYIFSMSEDSNEFYFQRVGKAALVQKKRFIWFGNNYKYYPDSASVVINDRPDAIYLKDSDTLYFRKLSSITVIFPNIIDLYREATNEEVAEFLKMDFLTAEGLTTDLVKTPNRKRIAMAMETLNSLDLSQRKEIFKYISEYCPSISNGENRFIVKDNDDLALVLFGIEQRFYTTPVGKERRIANSVITL